MTTFKVMDDGYCHSKDHATREAAQAAIDETRAEYIEDIRKAKQALMIADVALADLVLTIEEET